VVGGLEGGVEVEVGEEGRPGAVGVKDAGRELSGVGVHVGRGVDYGQIEAVQSLGKIKSKNISRESFLGFSFLKLHVYQWRSVHIRNLPRIWEKIPPLSHAYRPIKIYLYVSKFFFYEYDHIF